MMLFLRVLLMILFVVVLIQDVKSRAINIFLLPAILLCALFIRYKETGLYFTSVYLYNAIFLFVVFFVLSLYFSIRKKMLWNPFKDSMGIGDLLFFIAVIPLFDLHSYMYFFIIGLVFSMVVHLLVKSIKKSKDSTTVPLAGYLSLFLMIDLSIEMVSGKNFLLEI